MDPLKLRLSRFLCAVCRDQTVCVFSTRSGEFLQVDRALFASLLAGENGTIPAALREEMTQKKILVPEGEDELAEVLAARRPNRGAFRILTTTACNGTCSYCYEAGLPKQFMSAAIAEQTAEFLLRRWSEGCAPVLHLEWFGGEPLLNDEAIDIICRRLQALHVPFASRMSTNAALLRSAQIPRMRSLWALGSVQITLDGIGSAHERRKGLPQGSFARIMENIHSLLENDLRVRLRIIHTGKTEEEAELIRFLGREFSEPKPYVYLFPLYATKPEQMRRTMEEILELEKFLVEVGLADRERMYRFRQRNGRCYAADGGLTIGPDGRLFSCSHAMQAERCVGSVREFDRNDPLYQSFCRQELSQRCLECKFLPACLGGCRTAELGEADMFQCNPYQAVMDRIICWKSTV